jgi:ribosomal protein S18 acetylase RimI-like enzyme
MTQPLDPSVIAGSTSPLRPAGLDAPKAHPSLPSVRFRFLWDEPELDLTGLAAAFAPLVNEASQPFADWYFGDADVAAEVMAEWMLRPSSELFIGRAIVVGAGEDDMAGLLLAMTGAELTRARAADFSAYCDDLGSGPEADAVLQEILPVSQQLFPAVGPQELYISRVAVRPEQRGRGLGRTLVRRAIDHFRGLGTRRFRLDVATSNAQAIRAYQGAGMSIWKVSSSSSSGLSYVAMTAEFAD